MKFHKSKNSIDIWQDYCKSNAPVISKIATKTENALANMSVGYTKQNES